MKNKFLGILISLKKIHAHYDEETGLLKTGLLNTLSRLALPSGKQLLEYHDILLFFCTYPGHAHLLKLSEKELKRIAAHIKKSTATKKALNENQGLPYTETNTRFSPDLLSWLIRQKDINAIFDSMPEPSLPINEVMLVTLPSLLKEETTADLGFEALMEVLHVKPRDYISFLLGQLEQLDPLVRDIIMEHMDVYVRLVPKGLQYSRSFNRIPVQKVFFQQEMLKQFDHLQLINEPIPEAMVMSKTDHQQLCKVIKYAMPLTQREIDTASYLDDDTVRLFQLERGVMVAIHAMIPQRQLPLESSVGFTLFKNGIPVSYGGTWIFGPRARFGLNIFDAFRGGESGYTLCQLLRVFRHVFNISYFEVESYMFGYANPEGIKTGAFWFYYKYGFRPVDKELLRFAESEKHKIKTRKNYQSSEKTLIRFTQSNIALNLGDPVTTDVPEITGAVLSQFKKAWPHNYARARQEAIDSFCKKMEIDNTVLNGCELKVLEEVSLWAMAMKVDNTRQLELLKQMIFTKPRDLYAYQDLLLAFFEK
ncbi:MAG TPA: hypothetical protein VK483_16355 [Chitinophagaceae bacterium]|nr:hypothetical protein [Chitinophagaceae bacterium]